MHTTPKSQKKDYPIRPEADDASLDPNTSLWWMRQMVGRRKDVLDVGCASGYLARLLAANDCNVTGIEMNTEAAEAARAHCSRVFVADLDFAKLSDTVEGRSFDVLVFGDVLEHLRQPSQLLNEARQLLRADGYLVASIPNIAHGAIRLALLSGSFDYSELGILDETHLRFFTLKTIEEMFLETGYEIRRVERTKLPLFEKSNLVPGISRDEFDESVIAQIASDPEFDTLQFILQAFPLSDEARLAATTRHFVTANTELSKVSIRLERKEHELEANRKLLATATDEMQRAQERYAEAVAEQQKLTAQAAEGSAHRIELDLVRFQERLGFAESRNAELRERLLEREGQLKELRARQAELTESISQVQSELARSANQQSQYQTELTSLREELLLSNNELAVSREQASQYLVELAGSRDELLRSEALRVDANRELESIRNRFLVQTDQLLDRTRRETQQLSTLITVVQTSKFWSLKRFLGRLAGR